MTNLRKIALTISADILKDFLRRFSIEEVETKKGQLSGKELTAEIEKIALALIEKAEKQ